MTTFSIEQKITPLANQYRVRDASGTPVAFVKQKRLAMREKFTAMRDEGNDEVVLTVQARQVIDIGATYDVTDAAGRPIGLFRKQAGASLLRSTWQLEQPGLPVLTVAERNQLVAILRRVVDNVPWIFHFDGTGPDGAVAFSVERKRTLRDRYEVVVRDERYDPRLLWVLGVLLDAMQGR